MDALNAFRHHRNSHKYLSLMSFFILILRSTPFGIIGILTHWRDGKDPKEPALNAFRHHRNSHKIFPCEQLPADSAQRLSASSEFSLCVPPGSVTYNRGAQRLSASSEFSHCLVGNNPVEGCALNAFRHHRNSHSHDAKPGALRSSAQRLSASSEFSPVKEIGPHQSFSALNAFRHHRNSHRCHVMQSRDAHNVRSTPFGIIGILTTR